MKPATERFSDRVDDYAKYRPSYPNEVLDFLHGAKVLCPSSVVADVGSGTGLLTRLFVDRGHEVFAIEPNRAMREAGERALGSRCNFHSVAGRAESTKLEPASVDLVTAAQAFHWFDTSKARGEFQRILRPSGWVALVWNERENVSPFLEGYEALLRTYAPEYTALDGCHVDTRRIQEFYAPAPFEMVTFPNAQSLDLDGLCGRLRSSSYTPSEAEPAHAPMMRAMRGLFERHAERGTVEIVYRTRVYYGRLA